MTQIPYLQPTSTVPIPSPIYNQLSLTQFLQTVFVGISGLPGQFVRPKWQVEPPKQPDLYTNWMAIGVDSLTPDTYGYLWSNPQDAVESQRQETVEVSCSIYGPAALETYGLLRDGFQIPQNLEAINSANMAFTEIGPARKIPDLVHERWIIRVETAVFLRREVQRTYPILTLISANGTIYTDSYEQAKQYLVAWETQN